MNGQREVRPRHSSWEADERSRSDPAEEPVEPRAGAKGNAGQQSTRRAQDRESVSQALDRIRQAARQRKKEKFTALFHHLSIDLLEDAFGELKQDAAARRGWPDMDGVRGRTSSAISRTCTLGSTEERTGRCQAGGCTYPKPDGRQRPLAVAALEDKIVQRATVAVLNAIYEEDFLGFSYGFRPGRGAHDALDALAVGITSRKVNFILDADIRAFFDEVSQDWLIRFVEHRIGDPRIIRLIQKWLKAGVLEDGVVTDSDRGTGQGSVISPLLANIYLHYVFDLWAERWRRREAAGDMIIVRYADDIVVGFEHEDDARRFLDAMRERLERVCAVAASGQDPPDRVRPPCGGPTARGAGLASRRRSRSWASPSSAPSPAGATSCSSGRPGATACGRSCKPSSRNCDGACTSRSPSRGNGWGRSSEAGSTTTPCRPTVARSAPSASSSPTSGGARSGGAARRTA